MAKKYSPSREYLKWLKKHPFYLWKIVADTTVALSSIVAGGVDRYLKLQDQKQQELHTTTEQRQGGVYLHCEGGCNGAVININTAQQAKTSTGKDEGVDLSN